MILYLLKKAERIIPKIVGVDPDTASIESKD
jgi:hypothetical protein